MAFLGSLLGAGVGLLGNLFGQDEADDRGEQLLAQSQGPSSVVSPFGTFLRDGDSVNLSATPTQLTDLNRIRQGREGLFNTFNDPDFVQSEVDRLRGISRPREDALRASLRSQVFNRGRLGLGVGGGLTGNLFNPELAALEEGLARADMARISQARQEQNRQLGLLGGLFGLENDIFSQVSRNSGIAAGLRPSAAGLSGMAAADRRSMDANDAFFATLGNAVGGLNFGGIFGGNSASAPAGSASSIFSRIF